MIQNIVFGCDRGENAMSTVDTIDDLKIGLKTLHISFYFWKFIMQYLPRHISLVRFEEYNLL